MPLVERNGVTFHIQQLGAQGPPVVMLHGAFPSTLSVWYFTAAPRLARRRRVLLYDLRGHGLSSRPASGYGLRAMARDLAALVDGFSDGPIALVGHSFGAAIALRFAADFPAAVDRLVVIEAPLPVQDSPLFGWQKGEDIAETLQRVPQNILRRFSPSRRRRQRVRSGGNALYNGTTMTDDLRADGDLTDAELASICLPILLVYGTMSPLGPDAARLVRVLPEARITWLDGSHMLPFEAPDQVLATIEGFLDA